MRETLKRFYRGETRIDFVGRRKIWFSLSGLVILSALLLIPFRPTPARESCSPPLPSYFKGMRCGIEFRGGVAIQAPVPDDGPLAEAEDREVVSEVSSALRPLGAGDAVIQVAHEGDDRLVLVQTKEIADPERQAEVVETVSQTVGATIAETDSQRIGAKWGEEITGKAIRALLIFLVVVLAFISWRFEWKMAIAAIAALFHDLLVTAGVYSLVGFEVTPSTVIALLTILGYSLYDTVVVFDKVEEHTTTFAATGRMTYQDSANLAMNQVFMRSLNTSLTTLLPIAALLLVGAGMFGAETLQDLALALFVGILSGTYSSIFVATPILTTMKEREQRYRSVREKVLREARRAAVAPVPATGPSEVPESAPRAEAARPPAAGPSPRPRAGTKKARRRKRR